MPIDFTTENTPPESPVDDPSTQQGVGKSLVAVLLLAMIFMSGVEQFHQIYAQYFYNEILNLEGPRWWEISSWFSVIEMWG